MPVPQFCIEQHNGRLRRVPASRCGKGQKTKKAKAKRPAAQKPKPWGPHGVLTNKQARGVEVPEWQPPGLGSLDTADGGTRSNLPDPEAQREALEASEELHQANRAVQRLAHDEALNKVAAEKQARKDAAEALEATRKREAQDKVDAEAKKKRRRSLLKKAGVAAGTAALAGAALWAGNSDSPAAQAIRQRAQDALNEVVRQTGDTARQMFVPEGQRVPGVDGNPVDELDNTLRRAFAPMQQLPDEITQDPAQETAFDAYETPPGRGRTWDDTLEEMLGSAERNNTPRPSGPPPAPASRREPIAFPGYDTPRAGPADGEDEFFTPPTRARARFDAFRSRSSARGGRTRRRVPLFDSPDDHVFMGMATPQERAQRDQVLREEESTRSKSGEGFLNSPSTIRRLKLAISAAEKKKPNAIRRLNKVRDDLLRKVLGRGHKLEQAARYIASLSK